MKILNNIRRWFGELRRPITRPTEFERGTPAGAPPPEPLPQEKEAEGWFSHAWKPLLFFLVIPATLAAVIVFWIAIRESVSAQPLPIPLWVMGVIVGVIAFFAILAASLKSFARWWRKARPAPPNGEQNQFSLRFLLIGLVVLLYLILFGRGATWGELFLVALFGIALGVAAKLRKSVTWFENFVFTTMIVFLVVLTMKFVFPATFTILHGIKAKINERLDGVADGFAALPTASDHASKKEGWRLCDDARGITASEEEWQILVPGRTDCWTDWITIPTTWKEYRFHNWLEQDVALWLQNDMFLTLTKDEVKKTFRWMQPFRLRAQGETAILRVNPSLTTGRPREEERPREEFSAAGDSYVPQPCEEIRLAEFLPDPYPLTRESEECARIHLPSETYYELSAESGGLAVKFVGDPEFVPLVRNLVVTVGGPHSSRNPFWLTGKGEAILRRERPLSLAGTPSRPH